MKPATEESPAPTVLRTSIRGAVACQAPSAFTRTAPAPPSVTSTFAMPRSRRREAASTMSWRSPRTAASSKAAASPPVSWASSSELGLIRSNDAPGSASNTASRAASEVSTATRHPRGLRRAVSRAYQSVGAPGGRDPDRATHTAPRAASTRRSVATARSSTDRVGPGSLILVVVPSGSVIVVLVRGWRTVAGARTVRPAGRSASSDERYASSANGRTASVATPPAATTLATFTPLPAAWAEAAVARWTSPRARAEPSATVRSMLGLAVKVTTRTPWCAALLSAMSFSPSLECWHFYSGPSRTSARVLRGFMLFCVGFRPPRPVSPPRAARPRSPRAGRSRSRGRPRPPGRRTGRGGRPPAWRSR